MANEKNKRSITMTDELWNKIRARAEIEHRTATALVCVAVEEYLEKVLEDGKG